MIFIGFLPIPENAISFIKPIIPIENKFPAEKYIPRIDIILIRSLKLLLNIWQTGVDIICIEIAFLAEIKCILYETYIIE